MARDPVTAHSKLLSFVLRHEPQTIGLVLDGNGWADIDELLTKCRAHGKPLTRELLNTIVSSNKKQRFAISEDGTRIRANQGHSIEVDLAYAPATPPPRLFHGTVAAALSAIRHAGLLKMQRHHVHLSPDEETARVVAMRRGKPCILRIDAANMNTDGHVFYLSTNGVWLTEHVPPRYIEFPD
jgi:putative RNA 2'-phosphotransferase